MEFFVAGPSFKMGAKAYLDFISSTSADGSNSPVSSTRRMADGTHSAQRSEKKGAACTWFRRSGLSIVPLGTRLVRVREECPRLVTPAGRWLLGKHRPPSWEIYLSLGS